MSACELGTSEDFDQGFADGFEEGFASAVEANERQAELDRLCSLDVEAIFEDVASADAHCAERSGDPEATLLACERFEGEPVPSDSSCEAFSGDGAGAYDCPPSDYDDLACFCCPGS